MFWAEAKRQERWKLKSVKVSGDCQVMESRVQLCCSSRNDE